MSTFAKTIITALSIMVLAGCSEPTKADVEENLQRPTISIRCYAGTSIVYSHDNIIILANITDKDITASIREVDTKKKLRVPLSQCYLTFN